MDKFVNEKNLIGTGQFSRQCDQFNAPFGVYMIYLSDESHRSDESQSQFIQLLKK